MREKIIAEARSWIGTPYHNCADVKGVGVDCGMLIVRVFVDLGLVPPFDPRPYPRDWHMHNSDEERYLNLVLPRARRRDGSDPRRRDAVARRAILQSRRADFPPRSIEAVMTVETLCEALERGEPVKPRSFGSFNIRSKRGRVGRNPRTGVEAPITPRRVATFKPSPVLVARVNGETIADEEE